MSKQFTIQDKNTYSMSHLVDNQAITTYEQIGQAQTFVLYYDIKVQCYLYRADMCEQLTYLNQLSQDGLLPERKNKNGRGYLSADGIMELTNKNSIAYKCDKIMTLEDKAEILKPAVCDAINHVLSDCFANKTKLPIAAVTNPDLKQEDIISGAHVVVKAYKCSFDLNKSLEELKKSYEKLISATHNGPLKKRLNADQGESYIAEDNVIRFRLQQDKPVIKTEAPNVLVVEKSAEKQVVYIADSQFTKDKKQRIVWYGNQEWQKAIYITTRTSVAKYTQEIADTLEDYILMVSEKAGEINSSCEVRVINRLDEALMAFNRICKKL